VATLTTRKAAVCLGVLCAGLGCGEPAPFDPTSPAPLAALAVCEEPPAGSGGEVDGLVLPDASVVTSVEPGDPLTRVMAYVGATPISVRQELEGREDLEILISEDEVFESEMLVSEGEWRTYLKTTAICAEGSNILAVVAPEVDAQGLPIPQSSPSGAG